MQAINLKQTYSAVSLQLLRLLFKNEINRQNKKHKTD